MPARFSSLQKKISFHTILIPLITVIEKIVPTTEGESLILHSTTNTDTLKRENPTFPEKASGSFPTPKQCSSTSHPCLLSNKALQARFSSCGDRICGTVPFAAVQSPVGGCFIGNEVSYKKAPCRKTIFLAAGRFWQTAGMTRSAHHPLFYDCTVNVLVAVPLVKLTLI